MGNLLVPWLTSKTSRMNPVAVFVGVLAWGWLWGVWGLLLGIPIMMVVKAVCDRVEDLKPVGELLGDRRQPPGRSAGVAQARRDPVDRDVDAALHALVRALRRAR